MKISPTHISNLVTILKPKVFPASLSLKSDRGGEFIRMDETGIALNILLSYLCPNITYVQKEAVEGLVIKHEHVERAGQYVQDSDRMMKVYIEELINALDLVNVEFAEDYRY